MNPTRRDTGSALAIAALAVVVGVLGCGSGGEKAPPRSEAPATEGTTVTARASAVTVTYYYLPG